MTLEKSEGMSDRLQHILRLESNVKTLKERISAEEGNLLDTVAALERCGGGVRESKE